ncbi:HSP20-like chaperone [Entophlyctis helioformis]|nr:HSP20-like chaperone [Entophlyctis helioformis]
MSLISRDPFFSDPFDSTSLVSPWSLLDRFNRLAEVGPRFATSDVGFFRPNVDVWDTADAIKVHADLPGVPKEAVKADIDKNGNLIIEGETSSSRDYDQNQARIRERRYGRFQRVIGLPATVDTSNIQAKFENGVLDITIPKTTEKQRSKITIA